MKKKKKQREQRKRSDLLSCPRQERERERLEGQRGESTASELTYLTPTREEGSGRLATTEGGWVEKK